MATTSFTPVGRAIVTPCVAVVLLLGFGTACEELPPLEYESEHALVGTDQVDRVCAGTLARIDRTIEYVDGELGRETDDEPARIYIVELDELIDRCDDIVSGCVLDDGLVFTRPSAFDRVIGHEIVHERIARTSARGSKALLSEGIAVAFGNARAAPDEDHEPPSIDAILRASGGSELAELDYGYYHAGEFTHWLIEIQGVAQVLEFMADVRSSDPPDRVRKLYTEHFGRNLDEDLFRPARDDDELTRENLLCTGPELARDPKRLRFELQANLDCDSPRVENQWVFRDRGYVEWIIDIGENDAGFWAPVRFEGDDALPANTVLEIESCREKQISRKWSRTRNGAMELGPGLYRIRWSGPLDAKLDLDVEIGGPCDPNAPNCDVGERCVEPGICAPSSLQSAP
jgi:hypothetical protein